MQKIIYSSAASKKTYLNIKDRHHLTAKEWKDIFLSDEVRKQTGVVILISDNIFVKSKLIRWPREGHYILIKYKNPP